MTLNLETPKEIRASIRRGEWTKSTHGLAPGYVQANLVVLPQKLAFEFLLFCQRNPKPCPVLDVTEVGDPEPKLVAPGADLRTDIPKYRVYEYGELKRETTDIRAFWQSDSVAFLLGCSLTFEAALLQAGISLRHIEEGKIVPMYITNIPCQPAGLFQGPMVVTMRPIPEKRVVQAIQITARYPKVHGAPIHIGKPESIGISNLSQPDFGDAIRIKPGEVPLFWACGVTPQAVAQNAKLPLLISHAPGHMFITDILNEELSF